MVPVFRQSSFRRITAALALLALAACDSEADAPPPSAVGGDYALVNHDGRPTTPADFAGEPVIYYFGFTHCPDICPASLSVLSAALDRLDEAGVAVTPVFVTVDPERDGMDEMRAYLSWDDRFVGLTGEVPAVHAMLDRYRVWAEKVPLEDSELAYTVDHSSVFLLFDEEHRFVRPFTHNLTPEQLAGGVVQSL